MPFSQDYSKHPTSLQTMISCSPQVLAVMQDARFDGESAHSKWQAIVHQFQDRCLAWSDWYAGMMQWIRSKDEHLLDPHQWHCQKGTLSPAWTNKDINRQQAAMQRLIDDIQLVSQMHCLSHKMPSSVNLMIQANTCIPLLDSGSKGFFPVTHWADFPITLCHPCIVSHGLRHHASFDISGGLA